MRLSRILGAICLGLFGLAVAACFDQPAKQDPAKKQPDKQEAPKKERVEPRADFLVFHIVYFPDGKRVAVSGNRGIITWDLETGKAIRMMEFPYIMGPFAVSPNGKRILACGGLWTLYNAETGKIILRDKQEGQIYGCAFSPDGRMALAAGPAGPTLWDMENDRFKIIAVFPGHTDTVPSVAFSKGGKMAVSSSLDGTVKLWEIPSGKCLRTFDDSGQGYAKVHFTPDGKKVVSTGARVRAWQLDSGKLLYEPNITEKDFYPKSSCAVSPDGTLAVWVNEKNTAQVWKIPSQELQCALGEVKYDQLGRCPRFTFSPDGKRVISVFDSTFYIWDAETGKKVKSFDGWRGLEEGLR